MASNTSNALKNLTGTIALAGAGKMGGAMLAGWLAGGLDAERVVVIEPQPSDEISALAAKGVRLNPKDTGAVETLEDLVNARKHPSVRLGAARTIVELALHRHDSDTIMRKLSEVEAYQRDQLVASRRRAK